MAKFLSPNADYNGESASVKFVNGIGETDEPHLITWFLENGYAVQDELFVEEDENTHLSDETIQQPTDEVKVPVVSEEKISVETEAENPTPKVSNPKSKVK